MKNSIHNKVWRLIKHFMIDLTQARAGYYVPQQGTLHQRK